MKCRYIRTKDGRIIDLQKFIEEEKENPYYTDYEFEEIKNEEDCCSIHWTAIGTKENSIKDQIGRRCQFGATVDSSFINQANTIEELCDEFIVVHENGTHVIQKKVGNGLKDMDKDYHEYLKRNNQVFYGAIWTEWGLKYVAKMNEDGELCLI